MAATFPATAYQPPERTSPMRQPPERRRVAPWADGLFSAVAHGAAWLTLLLLVGIIVSLLAGAAPAIQHFGLPFLWSSDWDPVKEKFGGLVMIYGTVATSVIALLIAVPVSFGIAIFLTEMSPGWLKRPLGIAVELLAAVPSIVYGMWGLLVFSPILATYVQQPLQAAFKGVPVLGAFVSGAPVGIGLLSAGIILAIMIIPYIAAVMRDVFEVTPPMLKESAYGLGATTWEVVSRVVLPYTKAGVVAASCWAWAGRWARRWRSPLSSATSTSSIPCRCLRRPTASPRRWPMSLLKPVKACTRPRRSTWGWCCFSSPLWCCRCPSCCCRNCARAKEPAHERVIHCIYAGPAGQP